MKLIIEFFNDGRYDSEYNYLEDENGLITINIDLNTKKTNLKEDIYFKVVDRGTYTLVDGDTYIRVSNEYVPASIPNDYGDYLDLEVQDGKVSNFKTTKDEILENFMSYVEN